MVAIRLAGCYYSPNFSKNREEVTMETINGEIVVDWNDFTTKEVVVGEKIKIVIITDGYKGHKSSISVFGMVEAAILGHVMDEGYLFQRLRVHLTGGLKLDVFDMSTPERPHNFPCTLTYD